MRVIGPSEGGASTAAVLSAVIDFPHLQTPRLLLRRFRPEDLPAFCDYRNDREASRFDGPREITTEQGREIIKKMAVQSAAEPGVWMQIAIELLGEGLIGDCGFLVDLEQEDTAEIGYRLSRNQWGKGYATEAVGALLDWSFDSLGLHRVVARIDPRNAPSIALVERLGFRREGHFLESYREPVGWSDEYLYAMLERSWRR